MNDSKNHNYKTDDIPNIKFVENIAKQYYEFKEPMKKLSWDYINSRIKIKVNDVTLILNGIQYMIFTYFQYHKYGSCQNISDYINAPLDLIKKYLCLFEKYQYVSNNVLLSKDKYKFVLENIKPVKAIKIINFATKDIYKDDDSKISKNTKQKLDYDIVIDSRVVKVIKPLGENGIEIKNLFNNVCVYIKKYEKEYKLEQELFNRRISKLKDRGYLTIFNDNKSIKYCV